MLAVHRADVSAAVAVTLSFVDRHGIRHQIDFESWISFCAAWVVKNMDDQRCGIIEHRVPQRTINPVYAIGESRMHYTVGQTTVTEAEAMFAPSDEAITCLMCIANATGP